MNKHNLIKLTNNDNNEIVWYSQSNGKSINKLIRKILEEAKKTSSNKVLNDLWNKMFNNKK